MGSLFEPHRIRACSFSESKKLVFYKKLFQKKMGLIVINITYNKYFTKCTDANTHTHTHHEWPSRHRRPCSGISSLSGFLQNMRNALGQVTVLCPATISPNVSAFLFLRLSLLFFTDVL